MAPKVSPWLEGLEATNLSEDLCGATLSLGAASPKDLLLPRLAPRLSSCPAKPVPSFVVTTVVFLKKYLWSSIILRFLEERYYVNEN